ncbi:hypothetical protein [Bosea sp. ANAM02]|uniref:hypothetical protein n=1 Tax=Bosea sp. ANAM02 TaxID=2020412 RepID=UPI00140F342A|nr:hypothetical protein [Bosea sp. ANAM02]BCB22141.1 hypothetical protein OCUBac02_50350 [Bosea sp. ANAM02]
MPEMTKAAVEAAVLGDYEALKGQVVLARTIECYDDDANNVTVECDPPAVCRIEPYPDAEVRDNLLRWTDEENCDPILNLVVLEKHPAFAGVRPSWIYGTTRSLDGTTQAAGFELADATIQARYVGAKALPYQTGACAPEGAEPSFQRTFG